MASGTVFGNVDTLELRTTRDIGDRLAAHLAKVLQSDIAAHQLEDVDHTGTSRVDPYMLEHDLRARRNAGRDHEEGRRGDIRRHLDMGATQLVPRLDDRGASFDRYRVAETAQHPLGVITSRCRLGDGGLVGGIQPGQQQTGI